MNNTTPTQLHMQTAQFKPKPDAPNVYPIYYMTEQWVPLNLPNIQPGYFVSSLGRIFYTAYNCLIRPRFVGRGYLMVTLRTLENKSDDYLVHRLVMIAFCPIPNPENFQVNHINTIKTCNHLSNLEWVTCSQNIIHAYANGLYKTGEDNNFAKTSNEEAHTICKCLEKGMNIKEICKLLGWEYNNTIRARIQAIKNRRNWKQVSKDYNF